MGNIATMDAILAIAKRRSNAGNWDNQHDAYRGLALMDAVVRLLNRKDARAKVDGSQVTYTYEIEAAMMDDGSVAVEMTDEDSGDIYGFTLIVS